MIDIYLAGPYTDESREVMGSRYESLTRGAALLTGEGLAVFSPITHSAVMCDEHGLGHKWEHWKEVDRKFISSSREMWVMMLDGWRESVGVRAEVGIARELGLRVLYVLPERIYQRDSRKVLVRGFQDRVEMDAPEESSCAPE